MENFNDILKNVSVKAMVITPEIAQEYLTHNISNRRMDMKAVENYKRIFDKGQFTLSNDAICFGTNGVLLNGQHRLKACCETQKPFMAIVARGLPMESYVVMDNGKNRTASDVLYVQDTPRPALIAAIIRRWFVLNKQGTIVGSLSGSNSKFSNSEIEAEYKRRPNFWDEISLRASQISTHGKYHNLVVGSEVGATVAYLHCNKKHDIVKCFNFFEEIAGRQKPTNDVITLLQDKLRESKNFINKRLPPFVIHKLVIKAWNAYLTGKTYVNFYYNERTDKELWYI